MLESSASMPMPVPAAVAVGPISAHSVPLSASFRGFDLSCVRRRISSTFSDITSPVLVRYSIMDFGIKVPPVILAKVSLLPVWSRIILYTFAPKSEAG